MEGTQKLVSMETAGKEPLALPSGSHVLPVGGFIHGTCFQEASSTGLGAGGHNAIALPETCHILMGPIYCGPVRWT